LKFRPPFGLILLQSFLHSPLEDRFVEGGSSIAARSLPHSFEGYFLKMIWELRSNELHSEALSIQVFFLSSFSLRLLSSCELYPSIQFRGLENQRVRWKRPSYATTMAGILKKSAFFFSFSNSFSRLLPPPSSRQGFCLYRTVLKISDEVVPLCSPPTDGRT